MRSGIPAFHGSTTAGSTCCGRRRDDPGRALTGLVVLRTQGMAFIMITLAFAQMFFFLGISLKQYGGDDGIRLSRTVDLGHWTWRSPRSATT